MIPIDRRGLLAAGLAFAGSGRAWASEGPADLLFTAAYQHFEEATKGSITPGKQADLIVLSGNPLTVDPDALAGLKVVETFKEGRSIYRA